MGYWLGVATLTGIYLIAILGVSVLTGFTGLFSLGHAGFMAIGAYTSALMTKTFGVPQEVGIFCGMIAAMVIGILISYPTLRLKDDYFIIVTLGIGEAIKLTIQNLTDITGGARGLSDVPPGSSFIAVWITVIIIIIILRNFLWSKHGRNCIALREEHLAATSIGINAFRYKLLAMAVSCALCGVAGGLLAHYMHYLQPNMFSMVKSEELIIAVILGGRGSLTGTIIAALVLVPLPELLRFGSAQEWRMVLYGLLMVLVMIFRPSGLMGMRELTLTDIKKLFYKIANLFEKRRIKNEKC